MNINYEDYLEKDYDKHTSLENIKDFKTDFGYFGMSIRDPRFCEINCFINPFEELVWTNGYSGFIDIHNFDTAENDTDIENLCSTYNDVESKHYQTNTDNYEALIIEYDDGVAIYLHQKSDDKKLCAIFYKEEHNWKDEL